MASGSCHVIIKKLPYLDYGNYHSKYVVLTRKGWGVSTES